MKKFTKCFIINLLNKKESILQEDGTEVFISEGVASAPTVYSFLKNETKVFLTFVPRSSRSKCLIKKKKKGVVMCQF
ncbi:hypothetical protein FNV40_11985 [Enterococcus durans]|nr:hypothetical protein FNV40_11985 [Enterococcus durans]